MRAGRGKTTNTLSHRSVTESSSYRGGRKAMRQVSEKEPKLQIWAKRVARRRNVGDPDLSNEEQNSRGNEQ